MHDERKEFSKLLLAIIEEITAHKIVDHADDFVSVLKVEFGDDPPATLFTKLVAHKTKFVSHAETSALLSLLSLFS